MTREERREAGWIECWGAAFDDNNGGVVWWTGLSCHGGHGWTSHALATARFDFRTPGAVASWLRDMPSTTNVYAKRWWKRVKPKAPKAPSSLKVGDEVLVRAKVLLVGARPAVCIRTASDGQTWIDESDIVR